MLRFPVLIRRHGRYLTDMENTQVARRPSIESIPQPQPTSAAGLSASTSQAKSVDSPRRHVPRVRKPKHDAADPNTSTSPSKASMPARAGSGPRPQPSFAQQQRPRVEAAGHQSGSAIHLHTLPGGLPARARETQRSSPNWRSNASPFADKGKGRAVGTPAEEPEVSSDDNLSVLQVVSSLDRPLEAQLKALADSTKPSSSALKVRQELVRQIQRTLDWHYGQKKFERFEVVPFGSSVVGIASSTSDLDLCIIDHGLPKGYRGTKDDGELPRMYDMGFVRNRMQRNAYKLGVKSVLAVRAKVPICKIELHSGLQADINCNEQLGLRNSHLLRTYFQLAPEVTYPLAKFIKFWAKQRRLNDPSGHQGPVSLSSYSYILLMIAYLRSIMVLPNLQKRASDYEPEQKDIWWQMERKRGRRKQPAQHVATIGYDTSYLKKVEEGWKTAPVTLEQAAKGFFDFYSKFAFHEHIISIRHDEPFQRRKYPFEHQPTKQAARAAQLAADVKNLHLTPDPEEDADEESESDEEEIEAGAHERKEEHEDQPILADVLAARHNPQQLSADKAAPTSTEQEVTIELVNIFKEPRGWSSDRLAILDPFILSRNTVSHVNSATAETLQKELARASGLLDEGKSLIEICAPIKRDPGFDKGVPFRGTSKSSRRQRNKQQKHLAATGQNEVAPSLQQRVPIVPDKPRLQIDGGRRLAEGEREALAPRTKVANARAEKKQEDPNRETGAGSDQA